jgi:TolA-binding protein
MSILPTWPIAAGALVIGLAGGAFIDHKIMQSRIDQINIEHAEGLRVREVKRADDERAARTREQLLASQIGLIEQEKQNAINQASTTANALLERLRKQAASKPANPGGMPQAAPACETTAGPVISESTGNDLVSLAERADQQRAALSACYQAYDSIGQ